MELWFHERETDHLYIRCRIDRVLHRERSRFQDIAVLESPEMGRMLVLDGIVQTTLRDEFVYHEMMAHVPLYSHPDPRRVLVVGGGDGGTVREVLKHPGVEEVHLVEIDERVIEVCRRFLPELAGALSDPRVTIHIEDGVAYLAREADRYDVVIVDSTDPVGPGVGLFTEAFYASVARALRPGGLMVTQTESPFFNPALVQRIYRNIAAAFPRVFVFLADVPIYSIGLWSFTLGSKGPDPRAPRLGPGELPPFPTRYYTPEVHRAAFALPRYVRDLLAG